MLDIRDQYITDQAGERIGVILDLPTYRKLLEALEELEELRAFDEAIEASDETIPFDQAVAEIERDRK